MLKKIIILFLLGLTTSCGYEAQYSKKNFYLHNNFSIASTEFSGDRITNVSIKNILRNYSNIKREQSFTLNFKTESSTEIISKNSKGDPSRYKIRIEVQVKAIRNEDEKQRDMIFTKDYDYNNNGDVSALKVTEREIKISLAKTITDELIKKLVNFNDY